MEYALVTDIEFAGHYQKLCTEFIIFEELSSLMK